MFTLKKKKIIIQLLLIWTTSFNSWWGRADSLTNNLWIHSSPLIKKGIWSLTPYKFQSCLFLQTKGFSKPAARKKPFSRMIFFRALCTSLLNVVILRWPFITLQEEVPSQLWDFIEFCHHSLIVWYSIIEPKETYHKDWMNCCIIFFRVNFSSNIKQGYISFSMHILSQALSLRLINLSVSMGVQDYTSFQ